MANNVMALTAQEIKKLQYDILYTSTENNGYLQPSDVEILNKALKTTNKRVVNAINEVLSKANTSLNTITNFRDRFNDVMGNEIADPDLKTNLLKIGNNVQDAIYKLYDRELNLEKQFKDIGGLNTEELIAKLDRFEEIINNLVDSNTATSEIEKVSCNNNIITLLKEPINEACLEITVNGVNYYGKDPEICMISTDNKKDVIWLFTEVEGGFNLETTDTIVVKYNSKI